MRIIIGALLLFIGGLAFVVDVAILITATSIPEAYPGDPLTVGLFALAACLMPLGGYLVTRPER